MVFAGTIISQMVKSYFRFERPKEYKPLAFYVDECQICLTKIFSQF